MTQNKNQNTVHLDATKIRFFQQVDLALRAHTAFKMFEKIQAILLCWSAAQQQTSTLRGQIFSLLFFRFSVTFKKLALSF